MEDELCYQYIRCIIPIITLLEKHHEALLGVVNIVLSPFVLQTLNIHYVPDKMICTDDKKMNMIGRQVHSETGPPTIIIMYLCWE